MKLFVLAEEILNELYGISLDARVWGGPIRTNIRLSQNTPNPIIIGKDYPKEYKVFPIDFIHFKVDPRYIDSAVYDENKSGYDENNQYHVYFVFGDKVGYSGINHELRHAFEDFKKMSKGHQGIRRSKEGIDLFSGDFEKLMTFPDNRSFFRPFTTLLEGLYFTSKIERSAYAETVYDSPATTGIISGITELMQYSNVSNILNKYPSKELEEKWGEYKGSFHIPITDKFNNYMDFIKWACDEINYKGNITLKKLRKVKYNSLQIKKKG